MVPKTTASSDSPWFGLAIYAWSGWENQTCFWKERMCLNPTSATDFSLCRYVIECPNCAVIYRSRQYWYGNQDPVETVVRTEIQHVWPGVRTSSQSCFSMQQDEHRRQMLLTCVGSFFSLMASWKTTTMLHKGCWMGLNTFLNQCLNSASNPPKPWPRGSLTR